MKLQQLILILVLLGMGTKSVAASERWERNLLYRTEATDAYQRERCLLDLYIPEQGTEKLPVVIWFHGGSLKAKNKEVPELLRTKDYIVVGVNYRLAPKVKVAEIIDDAAAASAWVFNHISKYNGDTSRIVIAGHSAGAYLAAMITLDRKWMNRYGVDPNRFVACIPYSGQMISHMTYRAEQGLGALQPTIDEFAPIYHLRKDAPPMLLITGDRELELNGRYEENAYFWRMAQLNGMKQVVLHELQGFNHGGMAKPAHFLTLKYLQACLKNRH